MTSASIANGGWSTTTVGAAATRTLGTQLGARLCGGDVVALAGDLGAGKTTLVQGIVEGLGGGRATSPTFTLINQYSGRDGLHIVHVDAYRLGETSAAELELDTLGLGDLLGAPDTLVLIEWAERISSQLPSDRLEITLSHGEDEEERHIEICARGPRSAALLASLLAATASTA